jgi:malate dehydrogenase
MCSNLADKLTLCDIKPGLAAAFAEELNHVRASIGLDIEIDHCENDEDVSEADIILISVGQPRTPGVKMTRCDLAIQNGRIIKQVSQALVSRNRRAKYVVITNPVDSMAMLCKKYTKANFVISTGTNLETLRFRYKIAQALQTPVSSVAGWVGGEHGDAAIPLWSTVRIDSLPLERYLKSKNLVLSFQEIDSYVKKVSKFIVDNIGGTEFGPAASFRDIIREIVFNTGKFLPISTPMTFKQIPEPIFVSVPISLGSKIGNSLYDKLPNNEKDAVLEAAKAIYETYLTTVEILEP